MSKCPNGCPCPDYDCHDESNESDHDDIHALIFNPFAAEGDIYPDIPQIKYSLVDKDLNSEETWVSYSQIE